MDKHWAQKYVLGPLTEPEPSQETGLSSSHVVDRRRFSHQPAPVHLPPTPPPTPPLRYSLPSRKPSASQPPRNRHSFASASPARSSSQSQGDTSSRRSRHCLSVGPPPRRHSGLATPPDGRPINYVDSRLASVMTTRNSRPSSLLLAAHNIDFDSVTSSPAGSNPQRPRSLSPGFTSFASGSSHPSDLPRSRLSVDMSDRPLDKIRAEARAADRRHKQRKRATYTDCIDRLDTIAGEPYHHSGPFDAALPCRNRVKKYSPLAAVQESNLEAIRATPRENLIDSINRHVPLQGTATVAPGTTDLTGNVMDYSEGADLMREPDAPGGPYKRWSGIPYHPDDTKGKGEPSFSIERDLKAEKRRKHSSMPASAFETLPMLNKRQRPASVMPGSVAAKDVFPSAGPQRGEKLSDGIKRRLSILRRKKPSPAAGEAR